MSSAPHLIIRTSATTGSMSPALHDSPASPPIIESDDAPDQSVASSTVSMPQSKLSEALESVKAAAELDTRALRLEIKTLSARQISLEAEIATTTKERDDARSTYASLQKLYQEQCSKSQQRFHTMYLTIFQSCFGSI
ncbi:hypothetical protein BDZ89DRAFT_1206757 [Hymenopellis radicata]|nr:hypothetical protein BDZ89DRAFT_1206757 [Hymenopellis radicata]